MFDSGAVAIGTKIADGGKGMQDFVHGYIIHELERRNVLTITSNQIVLTE